MNITSRSRFALLAMLLGSGLLASGCTGSDEDVRITFCKQLALTQLSAPADSQWGETRRQIKRPEFAAITVNLQAGGQATCWFEYDAVEETAESHVDPLSAYSTLPYQVSLNGTQLSAQATLDAVNAEQRRQGRQAIEQLRQAVRQ